MSESSKGGYGGYRGSNPRPSVTFLTGLIGQDGTGEHVTSKINDVHQTDRAETPDAIRRRGVPFQGGR